MPRIEITIKTYPDPHMQTFREAQAFAQSAIGQAIQRTERNGVLEETRKYRIVQARIEPPTTETSQGSIIAICEAIK